MHRVRTGSDDNSDDDGTSVRNSRSSRNSTGAKEEFIAPSDDFDLKEDSDGKDGKMLLIVFVSMVFVGLGNKVSHRISNMKGRTHNPLI